MYRLLQREVGAVRGRRVDVGVLHEVEVEVEEEEQV